MGGIVSTAEIAATILLICGNGGTDKDFDCYDYYNNCVINRSLTPTLKDLEVCKKDETNGIKRIEKAKEEK
jgi:hypothetical protein